MPVLRQTGIHGCFVIEASRRGDARGWFQKTYHQSDFAAAGLNTDWREEYFSLSEPGVVRGMHFQLPPDDHEKMVTPVAGRVSDVILDLREGSPSFRQHVVIDLDADQAISVYIPRGCAHGFAARAPGSILFYKVATEYSPERDHGIAWDSFGHAWQVDEPILSPRDQTHPTLDAFVAGGSPFTFNG